MVGLDGHRFDSLTRALGALGTRRSLGSLFVCLTGLLALTPGVLEAASKKKKQRKNAKVEGPCGNGSGKANRCKRNRQCCTGYCQKGKKKRKKTGKKRKVQGRCRCRQAGQSCSEDRNCCPERTGRICKAGACQTPLCADLCPDGCCDGEICLTGDNDDACGAGGEQCQACAAGQVCWQGACACGDVCAGDACQFTSIQQAISQAAPGETIRICAGAYQEDGPIDIDRSLTLIGAGQGESGTVLDGQNARLVVNVRFMVTGVVLKDLRITSGGNSTHGGGISNEGEVALINCTITDCTADHGGGIFNAAYSAGGMSLINSTVSGNSANFGAGIYNDRGDVSLTGSTVSGNLADTEGGGIYRGGEAGVVTLITSEVCGNTPDQCFGFSDAACTETCPA